MAAITWRNVDGPSLGEASPILRAAGESFNAGFNTLDKMLQQRNEVQAKNWEAGKQNNTQAYLDAVAAAKTPAELAALEQSGALTQMAEGFGGQVDKNAIRGALATQLNTLRQAEMTTNKYNDDVLARQEEPIQQELRGYIATGNREAFNKRIAEVNIRNEDQLITAANAADQAKLEQTTKNKLNGLALTAAERAAKEAEVAAQTLAEDRAIQQRIVTAKQEFLGKQQKTALEMGKIAKNLGYPVTPAGTPDFDNMTEQQRLKLTSESIINGKITKNTLTGGDTEAANSFIASLSGKFSPDAINRNLATMTAAFDTTQLNKLSGNDAARQNKAIAMDNVGYAESDANNWYAPGSPDAIKAYENIATKVQGLVEPNQLVKVNKRIYKYATQGLELKDGTKVFPSENDIMAAVRSTKDTWGWNDHSDNIEKLLVDMLSTPEAKKRMADGEASAVHKRTQAVKKELQVMQNPIK